MKPRLGNVWLPRLARCETWLDAGGSDSPSVLPLDQSLLGARSPCARDRWLPSRMELPAAAAPPIRSGIASSVKATNESVPSTSAAQGAQRHLSGVGIPISRIREQA